MLCIKVQNIINNYNTPFLLLKFGLTPGSAAPSPILTELKNSAVRISPVQ